MDQLVYVAIWIPSLPLLMVCIAGIVLAARRLALQKRAARFAQLGFGALILRTVVSVFAQMITMRPRETFGSPVELAHKLLAVNTANTLLMLLGILFLLMAVLADRTVTPAQSG